jgi:flagellar basal-body rod protein FlgF
VQRTGAQNRSIRWAGSSWSNPPENTILVRGDDGLFRLATAARPQAPNVRVAGGYLEGSNVNVVDQVVAMISLARQFEMQTKHAVRRPSANDQQPRSCCPTDNRRQRP